MPRSFPPLPAVVPHEVHRLADGRALSFARYGAVGGQPVYYFHGCPGSRLEAAPADAAARAHGVSLYALERPGCGRSDPAPGYRVLDWPADVAHFADRMGHETFGIIGFSGGGTYVSACAHQLPRRLRFAYDLGGWGPVAQVPALQEHLAPLDRFFLQRLRSAPWLFSLPFALIGIAARWMSDRAFARAIWSSMGDDDRALMTESPEAAAYLRETVCASFAQGTAGPRDDAARCYSDWGFDLDEITFPTQLWHGTDDLFAPMSHAEHKHAAMAQSTLRRLDGRGHIHMPLLFGELFAHALTAP